MQIAPEELMSLVTDMAARRKDGEDVDFYTGVGLLAQRYKDQPGRSFCISERMRCLAELSSEPRMKGWTIQGTEEGCLFTHEAVFRAAARCPLRADEHDLWFDTEEFFRIALEETTAEGNA